MIFFKKKKPKILFIILDGLGDRPIKELSNQTPLAAAETPNLDFMINKGMGGLIKPVYKGDFPTSKDAHLTLFGYDLNKWKMGRGVFEAIGIGMKLEEGDVALRGDLASVDEKMIIKDRRSGRIRKAGPFLKAIQGIEIEGVNFLIGAGVGHRIGIVMRGKNLSENISDNDSHKINVTPKTVKALDNTPEAVFTARVLNKFLTKAHNILKNYPLNKKRIKQGKLPANYTLVRTAGMIKPIPSFWEKWQLKACCVAGAGLYKGIGKALGMDLIKVKGATGNFDTDIKAKLKAAKRSLKKYNFCFLHIKATDDFSHDGNFKGKRDFIEKFDKELKPVIGLKKTIVVVTGDHCTPCALKQHSNDPVPVLLYGDGRDGLIKFSEKECQKGKIGTIKSINFMVGVGELARQLAECP
jgi:2,3-bisphosphoglycerate-independent phosphoglycerate mutase